MIIIALIIGILVIHNVIYDVIEFKNLCDEKIYSFSVYLFAYFFFCFT